MTTKTRGMILFVLLLFFLPFTCGCSEKAATVSGKVTLNGKPLANYKVHFEPMNVKDSLRKSAQGITNEKGEYTLTSVLGNKPGCPVGTCHVRFAWVDPEPPKMSGSEIIYNPPYKLPVSCEDGSMTFTVPVSGTTDANFDLKSK